MLTATVSESHAVHAAGFPAVASRELLRFTKASKITHRDPMTLRPISNEIEFTELSEGVFSFSLPGEKKLQTAVRLDVGEHALGVHAFVCRSPDENHVSSTSVS